MWYNNCLKKCKQQKALLHVSTWVAFFRRVSMREKSGEHMFCVRAKHVIKNGTTRKLKIKKNSNTIPLTR